MSSAPPAASPPQSSPRPAAGPPLVREDLSRAVRLARPRRPLQPLPEQQGEWVEITHDGRRAVNLKGWTLADEDGHTYCFGHYRLRSHKSVRIHTGHGRDGHLFQDRRHYMWDNRSDTDTLRSDNDRRIDRESWDAATAADTAAGTTTAAPLSQLRPVPVRR